MLDDFTFILQLKVHSIVTKIKEHLNVSYKDAMKMFYMSRLYKALEKEDTKMWYFSSYHLFNMFLEEKETGKYSCGEI